MKPSIHFLRKVAAGEVARSAGYSMRKGGYSSIRGGESAWKKHAAAGFVTPIGSASMGRPCYAQLTPEGEAALAAAPVGRNPQGHDPQGHGAQHEHAVPEGQALKLPSETHHDH